MFNIDKSNHTVSCVLWCSINHIQNYEGCKPVLFEVLQDTMAWIKTDQHNWHIGTISKTQSKKYLLQRKWANNKTKLNNCKRKYLKKWRKNGRVVDRQNANALNPQIRKAMYEERKQQIRRKIKPGNSQTLWDSVKIATDKLSKHNGIFSLSMSVNNWRWWYRIVVW